MSEQSPGAHCPQWRISDGDGTVLAPWGAVGTRAEHGAAAPLISPSEHRGSPLERVGFQARPDPLPSGRFPLLPLCRCAKFRNVTKRESEKNGTATTGKKRNETEPLIPSHSPVLSLAPSGWAAAGRKLRAARLGEFPDPEEAAGLLLAFACDRAPLREARTGRLDLSPLTVTVYRREGKRFAGWAAAAGVNLLRVTGDDLRRYAGERLSAGERAQTVRRGATIARMIALALRWAGLDSVPLPDAPRISDPVKAWEKRLPPSWADFARAAASTAAAALDSKNPDVLRVAAAALLAGTSGLRASELVSLTWGDLDTGRGILRVDGKGGRERRSPVTPETLAVLAALGAGQRPTAPILPSAKGGRLTRGSLWRILREWQRAHGLPSGVHTLRHAAGTRTAAECGIEAARDLLGHSTTRTTETYAKRAAAEALRPRLAAALTVAQ